MAVKKTQTAAKSGDTAEVKTTEAAQTAKVSGKTAPAKKTAAKKPAAKASKTAAEKKVTVKVQYGDKEIDLDDVVAACKADYKTKTNGHVRSIDVYIKPEDSAAYYVANKKYNDKIDL